MAAHAPAGDTAAPSLATLAWSMARLGAISYGGNNALLMARLVVDRRRWLSKADMDQAIATATLAPGGNSSNLSYEVGRRLRGTAGGLVAYVSMAAPGVALILLVGSLLLRAGARPVVAGILAGAEAAAVAMIAAVAVRLRARSVHRPLDWALVVILFLLVGVLHWQLQYCAPPVVALAWLARRKGA